MINKKLVRIAQITHFFWIILGELKISKSIKICLSNGKGKF